jgi:hypothetical protein
MAAGYSRIEFNEFLNKESEFINPVISTEVYEFGEPVTRENFTDFLIDSFVKSRGNASIQAIYFKYLENVQNSFVTRANIEDFLHVGGFSILTQDEQSKLISIFSKVKQHNPVIKLKDDIRQFERTFNMNLLYALRIIQNEGGTMILDSNIYRVVNFDQSILDLDKEEFLIWIAENVSTFNMAQKIGTL